MIARTRTPQTAEVVSEGCEVASAWHRWFEVDLPKGTIIANFRLGLLLRLLQLASVWAAIVLLTRPGARYKLHAPLSMGPTAMWFQSEGYDTVAAEDRRKPFCTQPASLDYKFSDEWVYTNYTCMELPPQERFWKDGPTMPFSPLSFREDVVHVAPAPGKESSRCSELSLPCPWTWRPEGVESCQCSTSSMHFVLGVEALHLHLIHHFTLEKERDPFVPFSVGESSRHYSDRPSDQMLTFVQVQGQGGTGYLWSFDPGENIRIPLRRILNVTELSMDAPCEGSPNLFKCGATGASRDSCRTDVHDYALMRQTGMSLGVHFQYVNQNMRHSLGNDFLADPRVTDRLQEHMGPIARITITAHAAWEGRPSQDCSVQASITGLTTVCRYRYNYGIRVAVTTDSYFGYFSPFLFAMAAGVASTYLRLPSWFVGRLAMYGLGTTSRLYKKAVKERFSIARGFVGYVIRRCSALWAFASIAGSEDAMISKNLISNTIRASLKDVVPRKDLDAIVERTIESYKTDEAGKLTLDKFLKAHESFEKLDAHELARHVSDRTTCLERLFAPHSHRDFRAAASARRRGSMDAAPDMGNLEEFVGTTRRTISDSLARNGLSHRRLVSDYESSVDSDEAESSESDSDWGPKPQSK